MTFLTEESSFNFQQFLEESSSISTSTTSLYYYEVCFKCSSDIYQSNQSYSYGDMVIVVSGNGYNIGFIVREFLPSIEEFPLFHEDGTTFEAKKIISHLIDDDNTIKDMLCNKIQSENFAFNLCLYHMNGRKIGLFAEIIGTEFQFDRKKLTVYLKLYSEVSVCQLVRKLYEIFRLRVKIINIDNPDIIYNRTQRYLEISKLNVSFDDIFKKENPQNIGLQLKQMKQSQIHSPNQNQQNNQSNKVSTISHKKVTKPIVPIHPSQNYDSSLSSHFYDLKSNFHFYQSNSQNDVHFTSTPITSHLNFPSSIPLSHPLPSHYHQHHDYQQQQHQNHHPHQQQQSRKSKKSSLSSSSSSTPPFSSSFSNKF